MMRRERRAGTVSRRLALVALVAAVGACDELEGDLYGPGALDPPRSVDARYTWVFQGWESGQPRGTPSVELTWSLPSDWDGEAFRVYARRAGRGDYTLIATVTSCGSRECRYSDANVRPATTYDYFVTAVDERSGRESDGSERRRVDVPATTVPETPGNVRAVGLDGAVYLQWSPTGAVAYWVLLESDDPSKPFDVGRTDGRGYLDTRAVNGNRYRYRLAAVDGDGHVGALSAPITAIPRPDHQAELLYALADSAAASGFRFVAADSLNPIVPGNASTAQLRLEVINGTLSLVPLNGTTITTGVLTTALTCGPGSDPDCVAIEHANAADAPKDFSSRAVVVAPELTYLVRVRGGDGRTRYGKLRVALEGQDQRGRNLAVFDWAYQLIPDEPSLHRR